MKLRNDYPIYLNPGFAELEELSEYWDTIRICVVEEEGDILLASGYGNTHSTIGHFYKQQSKKRRLFLDCFILYKRDNTAYLNTTDRRGGRFADRRFSKYLSKDHVLLIKDLIQLSGLE